MKKWICLGLVCVLLGGLACAGMAEVPAEAADAETASFRALAEAYVPMAVEDCPDHTVFQVIGSMEAQQLKNAYCLRCNNAIRTILGGTSYKLSNSACPHTLYMIQDPYEDQLVSANDYTHLQGQAHAALCSDCSQSVTVMLNGVRNLHSLSYKASVELDCDVHCFFYHCTDCGHIVSFSRGCDRSEKY